MINITRDLCTNSAQISIPMNIQWDTRIKLAEPGLSWGKKDRWQYFTYCFSKTEREI